MNNYNFPPTEIQMLFPKDNPNAIMYIYATQSGEFKLLPMSSELKVQDAWTVLDIINFIESRYYFVEICYTRSERYFNLYCENTKQYLYQSDLVNIETEDKNVDSLTETDHLLGIINTFIKNENEKYSKNNLKY